MRHHDYVTVDQTIASLRALASSPGQPMELRELLITAAAHLGMQQASMHGVGMVVELLREQVDLIEREADRLREAARG